MDVLGLSRAAVAVGNSNGRNSLYRAPRRPRSKAVHGVRFPLSKSRRSALRSDELYVPLGEKKDAVTVDASVLPGILRLLL